MKFHRIVNLSMLCLLASMSNAGGASRSVSGKAAGGWYTEGNFEPKKRIELTISNPLKIDRRDCRVIIMRRELPFQNIAQRTITVVDPMLPGNPEPTEEELAAAGGNISRLARKLGVARSTLRYRISLHKILRQNPQD